MKFNWNLFASSSVDTFEPNNLPRPQPNKQ
uniref:Uncharacterized protein n=1 Tax=Arundo donax TaxID=35708 RepID=A0A0A9U1F5_ARUDO